MKTSRILPLLILLCFFPFPAFAQNFTIVSGTIVDPNGLPWSYATIQAQLVPTGTAPSINGVQIEAYTSASADVNGTFSMTLGANAVIVPGGSQWQFTVTLVPGIPQPAGTGPQKFVAVLKIRGTSQNISANLNALAPKLYSFVSGTSFGVVSNSNAANNETTDDTTLNTAVINSVSGGGTAFLGNNTNWTPGSFTPPSANWTTTALGGKTTVKSTWTLPNLTKLGCHDPAQGAINSFFSYLPLCPIVPSPTSISPVVNLTGQGNYLREVQVAGFNGTGINVQQVNLFLDDVFSSANVNTAIPLVSTAGFGHYFHRGGFAAVAGGNCATAPSIFMHSSGASLLNDPSRIDEFDKTFVNFCGIHYDTVGTPVVGSPSTNIRSIMQLYENGAGDPLLDFDITGNAYQFVSIYDPVISDNTGTTPVVGVAGSGPGFLKDIQIWNPSGNKVFSIASNLANQSKVQNSFIFGPSSGVGPSILGLYGANASYFLFRNSTAIFNSFGTSGGGAFTSIGNLQVGMGDPYQFACTGSGSGGTIPAGTYYVSAAYEDAAGNEGQLSGEVGPITLSGSTSSLNCTWANQAFETGSVVATRIFTGSVSETYTRRYRTTNVGSFTVTGAGGTGASPTQLMPNANTMALTTNFGRTRTQSAANEFFGMGTNVNVGVGTQTPGVGYKLDVVGPVRSTKLAIITTTVGALPSAASNAGAMISVSDSTAIAAEGQTCVGGSSNTALAFSNGTVWKCF